MPAQTGIEPALSVPIQIGRLATLPVMDNTPHRPGALTAPRIASPVLGRHGFPRPLRALTSRLQPPVVKMNGIRPIGRLFKMDGKTGHAHCYSDATTGDMLRRKREVYLSHGQVGQDCVP